MAAPPPGTTPVVKQEEGEKQGTKDMLAESVPSIKKMVAFPGEFCLQLVDQNRLTQLL